MKKLYALITLTFTTTILLFASSGEDDPAVYLKRSNEPIRLDGELNEAAWFAGKPAKDFWLYFPSDTVRADLQTEIYMTYDDNNLYIAAKCYSQGNDYIVPSLRRDYRAGGNDNITFLLDPFNDRTNAFVFGMNPYGVTREALISNGGRGRDSWDSSWDNKWDGISKIHDGFWVCEIAIPFSTLRFTEGSKEWRFNSYRFDTQSSTNSTWMRIPRNEIIMDLAYMGKMIWEEPLKKPGSNISVIPYVSVNSARDFEAENGTSDFDYSVGGDAKIGVTSGLNLDLTVNPDFSQVEVDRQVLNLDRFEIFFPERRQFFLENADLFGRFGDSRINPFFSRRIGSARVEDENGDGLTIQNPILLGARLSGKLNNNWRLGLLNMQTADDDQYGLPGYNYTVAAVQRKLFSRSNVGIIFANKQATGDIENTEAYSEYNRVVGIDYNLSSANNRWNGKVFYHQVFDESEDGEKFAHGGRIQYRNRQYSFSWSHQYVGEGFDPEIGFVPRKDFFRMRQEARLFFYPEKGAINRHGPGLEVSHLFTPGFGRSDHSYELSWGFRLSNTGNARISVQNDYTYLFSDFDPTRTDSEPLAGEQGYTYTSVRGFFSSDRRKKLSYNLRPNIGEFFNGFRAGLGGSLTYRYQPLGQITLDFNYSYINLPDPHATASLFLIGPRIDVTFTKSLFLTTFIQYNNQIDNININARLQWRFAPVSDFFIVYTDNYLTDNFSVKNRAIVAKFTYWLNL